MLIRYLKRHYDSGTLNTSLGYNVQEECKKIRGVSKIAALVTPTPIFACLGLRLSDFVSTDAGGWILVDVLVMSETAVVSDRNSVENNNLQACDNYAQLEFPYKLRLYTCKFRLI